MGRILEGQKIWVNSNKMYDPKIHNGGYLKWHYQGMGLQPVHKQTYFNIVAISL
ncbi:hypothetical protein [Candidatus Hakubella thermalkaliphila]|nr:hypothetical protein [Candidatus Hakubella thermalkaliphila]